MRKSIFFAVFFLFLIQSKAQSWTTLGPALDYYPNKLKEHNGKLYAGGDFLMAGGDIVKGIATFDGIRWDSIGSGVCNGTVNALEFYNNELYIGGNFYFADNCSKWPWPTGERSNVYWNGMTWNSVGSGGTVNNGDIVRAYAEYNGDLYVGGEFGSIGGINAVGIAKWNGSGWATVGTCNAPFSVYCMAVYNGELYVGGGMSLSCVTGNTATYYNLAKWNGIKWDTVGGAVNGLVTSMLVDTANNALYIGGGFTNVAGTPCWSVAKWDGSIWSSPGGMGITNGATSLCLFNGELYVGGYWTHGLATDTVLAKYDGTSWQQVLGPHTTVTALGLYNGNLYVGGYFDSVLTMQANHIACYGNSCPQGVGINELHVEGLKFKIYPNPAKEEINILINEDRNNEYVLRIYNNTGTKVLERKVLRQTNINTADFSKGVYQVQICDCRGSVCHAERVVLQ